MGPATTGVTCTLLHAHAYIRTGTTLPVTNVHTHRERTHFLLLTNSPQDNSYTGPHPSYTHNTHPEMYLADAHKHTPQSSRGRPPPEMRKAVGTRAVNWGGTASAPASKSTAGAACDSPQRADKGRPETRRRWSSSFQTLSPRCPHQLPAISVSTPFCKATSCVTFTFSLWGSGTPFSSLSQPHITNAQGKPVVRETASAQKLRTFFQCPSRFL